MPSEEAAVALLRERGFAGPVALAIVTGTGLGALVDALTDRTSIAYGEIPGFPAPGVSGHGGHLHRGTLSGRPVLVLEDGPMPMSGAMPAPCGFPSRRSRHWGRRVSS